MAAVCRSGYYQLYAAARPIHVSRGRKDQVFISCRLDYCNSQFYGITEGLMSRLQSVQNVGCTFGVGRSTVRPHHASVASATGAALTSSSTSGGFQDGHPGLPVTVRHGSSLSGRRLPVGLPRRSSSAAFCHIEDVRCEANLTYRVAQIK